MSTARLFDPTSATMSKRRIVDTQDFLAVILVGYGESLYPFTEGTNVTSKALMPVGNVPIINLVLDWIIESGLQDILMIVPPSYYSAISNHLDEYYSVDSHPRLQLNLKRHTDGEKEEDDETSEVSHDQAAGGREGTARLLRRFRNQIKSDFVLLPCDLATPPNVTLSSILDKHRANPDAVLTSVLYEPVESVAEDEEKILTALNRKTNEVLLIEPLEGQEEEEVDNRTSLMFSHPSLSYSTSLLDSHIYVFRNTVLDLLATRRPKDLASVREQFVPWLIKGSWQQGLHERWASILDPPKRDIFASALALSTTSRSSARRLALAEGGSSFARDSPSPPGTASLESSVILSPSGSMSHKLDTTIRKSKTPATWKCQTIVVVPQRVEATVQQGKGKDKAKTPPAEPFHLIRANSLAGYWELNRRFLRTMAPTINVQPPATPTSARPEDGQAVPAISPSAQISPDSLLGESTKVGEKASIKKCIVGRHCNIGRGAKLTGCVLWDFVTVEENARIENAILCSNVRIGEKATIKDCEFGPGFEAQPSSNLKGERLVAGQE